MDSFGYTNHAVERFVERFPDLLQAGVAPKVSLHRAMQGASHERGFMNDSRRIVWMLEKYGDFNFEYYLKDYVGRPSPVLRARRWQTLKEEAKHEALRDLAHRRERLARPRRVGQGRLEQPVEALEVVAQILGHLRPRRCVTR